MTPRGARKDKDKAKSGVERDARSARRHLTPAQYERLLKIMALLLPRYYYHHRELAKALGISTRTLQRDITALQERGIHIRQERGGYRPPRPG